MWHSVTGGSVADLQSLVWSSGWVTVFMTLQGGGESVIEFANMEFVICFTFHFFWYIDNFSFFFPVDTTVQQLIKYIFIILNNSPNLFVFRYSDIEENVHL